MLEQGLRETKISLQDATLFCADIGPGSFIGSRVSVTLGKTFALARGTKVAGASAFDLIDPHNTVVLPSKKGEFFVRRVGQNPFRVTDLPDHPFVGYGSGIAVQTVPNAGRFSSLLGQLQPVEPELLLPQYLIEPSISTPKKPFA